MLCFFYRIFWSALIAAVPGGRTGGAKLLEPFAPFRAGLPGFHRSKFSQSKFATRTRQQAPHLSQEHKKTGVCCFSHATLSRRRQRIRWHRFGCGWKIREFVVPAEIISQADHI